jgi:hypothetical protein
LQAGFSYTGLLLGGLTNQGSTSKLFAEDDDDQLDISMFNNMHINRVIKLKNYSYVK